MVCMESLRSSNGLISAYFDNIYLTLPTYADFMMLFHSIGSKFKKSSAFKWPYFICFDSFRLKLSTRVYFMVLSHSMESKYIYSKNRYS